MCFRCVTHLFHVALVVPLVFVGQDVIPILNTVGEVILIVLQINMVILIVQNHNLHFLYLIAFIPVFIIKGLFIFIT